MIAGAPTLPTLDFRRFHGVLEDRSVMRFQGRVAQVIGLSIEVEGLRLGVVHETGQATGREARMAATYADLDVLVFGHSHIPWDTTTASGLRLLNPGSPTDRRRQPHCTYMTAVVDGGELRDVTLHRLPPRG